MTWLDDMHREAVALALPLWKWRDGDEVSILCGIDPGSTFDDSHFYITIDVEREGGIKASRYMDGPEAAEFFNDLMERGSQETAGRTRNT